MPKKAIEYKTGFEAVCYNKFTHHLHKAMVKLSHSPNTTESFSFQNGAKDTFKVTMPILRSGSNHRTKVKADTYCRIFKTILKTITAWTFQRDTLRQSDKYVIKLSISTMVKEGDFDKPNKFRDRHFQDYKMFMENLTIQMLPLEKVYNLFNNVSIETIDDIPTENLLIELNRKVFENENFNILHSHSFSMPSCVYQLSPIAMSLFLYSNLLIKLTKSKNHDMVLETALNVLPIMYDPAKATHKVEGDSIEESILEPLKMAISEINQVMKQVDLDGGNIDFLELKLPSKISEKKRFSVFVISEIKLCTHCSENYKRKIAKYNRKKSPKKKKNTKEGNILQDKELEVI